jgi:hypothetical protein
MNIIAVVIIGFIILEATNVIALYFIPGSKYAGVTIFIGIQSQSHASCQMDKLCYVAVFDSKHGRMPSSADSTIGDIGRNTGCGAPDVSSSDATRHYPLQPHTSHSCPVKINGTPGDK